MAYRSLPLSFALFAQACVSPEFLANQRLGTHQQTIGPDGATLMVPGASLRVPAGALQWLTNVSLSVTGGDVFPPAQVQVAASSLAGGPVSFQRPLRLALQLAPDAPTDATLLVGASAAPSALDTGSLVAMVEVATGSGWSGQVVSRRSVAEDSSWTVWLGEGRFEQTVEVQWATSSSWSGPSVRSPSSLLSVALGPGDLQLEFPTSRAVVAGDIVSFEASEVRAVFHAIREKNEWARYTATHGRLVVEEWGTQRGRFLLSGVVFRRSTDCVPGCAGFPEVALIERAKVRAP